MKKALLLLLLSAPVFAGQSIVLSTQNVSATVIAIQPNNSWTLEYCIHDWDSNRDFEYHPADLSAIGGNTYFHDFGFGGWGLQMYGADESVGALHNVRLDNLATKFATIRWIHDASTLTDTVQAWDILGNRFTNISDPFVESGANSNGIILQGAGTSKAMSWGYFRIYASALSVNATAPTTAQDATNSKVYWKFDGGNNTPSLVDISSNSFTATISAGGPTYIATPGQSLIGANFATSDAPTWSTWSTMKAGGSATLVGSGYSQADDTPNINCFFQALSWPQGAPPPYFNTHSSCTVVMSGMVFGNYNIQMQATSNAGGISVFTQDIGAAAYDSNAVLISSNPAVKTIFGDQLVFGRYNPWGYYEERAAKMIPQQTTYLQSIQDLTWITPGAGTIHYPFGTTGRFPFNTSSGTFTTADISSTSMKIFISDASKITLISTPTWVYVGGLAFSATAGELVRISSASALTGPATLYVAYDGRGLSGDITDGGAAFVTPAQAWTSGAVVGEMRIDGTGTQFVSDPNRPLCPAGAPGPMGTVNLTSGTVTLIPSSTTVTASGFAFGPGMVRWSIRVQATHDGGTPFIWWGQIIAYIDSTHVTISRPAPPGVDGTAFNYAVTKQIFPSLEFKTDIDGHIARTIQGGPGCESETVAFALPFHDYGATINPQFFSGVKYSYKKLLFNISNFNTAPFYYGPGTALRIFYLRSGYGPALTQANLWDEYYLTDPQTADGYQGVNPLVRGAPIAGAAIDMATNPSTILKWNNFDYPAYLGSTIAPQPCNSDDTRDTGYLTSWTAIADLFDNTSSSLPYHGYMESILARDQNCIRNASDGYTGSQVNSFATSFNWDPNFWPNTIADTPKPLILTNGSAAVTGTGFNPILCPGIASGTIHVTTGQSSATIVTGALPQGIKIYISDISSSPVYVTSYEYLAYTSSITMAGKWRSNTGTYDYMIEDGREMSYFISISSGNPENVYSNQQNAKSWTCMYNSPTSLTLNRKWDQATTSSLPSGTSFYLASNVVGAFEQQPLMYGIASTKINWAAQSADTTVAAGYQAMQPKIGNWMKTYAYDANTKGTFYATVSQACDPFVVGTSSPPVFVSIAGYDPIHGTSSCGNSGNSGDQTEMINTAEGGNAMLNAYFADPSQATKDFIDGYYGTLWGYCPLTANGYTCNSTYHSGDPNTLISDSGLAGAKWPGFFFRWNFGAGWPAVRLGGVAAAVPRTLQVSFKLSSITNAAKVRISLTEPDGYVVQNICTTSPCSVTGDARQGKHYLKIEYLSSGDAVLGSGDQQLLGVQ